MIAARRLQMIAGGCECKRPAKGGRDNRAGVSAVINSLHICAKNKILNL